MTVKNFVELVELIENQLGWVVQETPKQPMWRQRRAMAGRIKKAAAEQPSLLTLANLELTVYWLHNRREAVRSPFYVIYRVKDALKETLGEKQTPKPYLELIQQAIQLERLIKAPGHDEWETRLIRVWGSYREQVYNEWLAERGHRWVS